MTADPRQAIIGSYLERLKLPAIARTYVTLAREAESTNATYLDYLRTLLEQEATQRDESQIRHRLRQAQLPYDKRLEDFDCSAVPAKT
jgi:DNA replication protein DnaC